MRSLIILLVGLLLLSVMLSPAIGADPTSVPEKVLKELNFMAGKWETVATEGNNPYRTLSDERVWSPGKHCLIFAWSGEKDGTKLFASAISGWNQTINQVTEHWYYSDGTWFEVRYPVDKMKDGVWEGTMSWCEPDGRKITGTCRLEKGNDEYTWIAEWTEGGQKQVAKLRTHKIRA
jgi:hypothetical protein